MILPCGAGFATSCPSGVMACGGWCAWTSVGAGDGGRRAALINVMACCGTPSACGGACVAVACGVTGDVAAEVTSGCVAGRGVCGCPCNTSGLGARMAVGGRNADTLADTGKDGRGGRTVLLWGRTRCGLCVGVGGCMAAA